MGFRFRRSVRILPGVRLSLSKSGTSVSLGGRGFHYTIGPNGTRVTAGLPGTGLSWTQYTPHSHKRSGPQDVLPPPLPSIPAHAEDHVAVEAIQSASAGHISALSTSELAPILNRACRRIPLAPFVLVLCLLLFVASLMQKDTSWVGLTALYAAIFIPIAIFIDRYRRSVKVALDPEGMIARISEALSVAFRELAQTDSAWIVHAEGRTTDWKRNAGATGLTKRKRTSLRFGKPTCIRGGVKFPSFQVGSDEIYLLPDAALAVVRGRVASVSYRELGFSSNIVRFIEEERVPSDTTIVDHTWRYVNKSGGPDRRFINNKQIPVCLYSELTFRSEGGLNCKLQVSRPSAADPLHNVIETLMRTPAEIPKSVTYIRPANRWPALAFAIVFGSLGLVEGTLFQHDIRERLAANIPETQIAVRPSAKSETLPGTLNKPNELPSPLDLTPPAIHADAGLAPSTGSSSQQPLDLNDPRNALWVQSRLRELGFFRGDSRGWDSFSRSALRDFKTTNNLPSDDAWDLQTQTALETGPLLRANQTFVGSWSEALCEADKPDVYINSRRAVSAAGGVCDFSNIRHAGSSWIVATTCTNAGEKWQATIQLALSGSQLIWTGRDGSQTRYRRCQ